MSTMVTRSEKEVLSNESSSENLRSSLTNPSSSSISSTSSSSTITTTPTSPSSATVTSPTINVSCNNTKAQSPSSSSTAATATQSTEITQQKEISCPLTSPTVLAATVASTTNTNSTTTTTTTTTTVLSSSIRTLETRSSSKGNIVCENNSSVIISSINDEIVSLSSPEPCLLDDNLSGSPTLQQQQQQGFFQRQHLLSAARPSSSSFSLNKNEEFEFEVPEEAPVFVPTEQEFRNPLTYISKIRPIAEKYGICKIRPPATWQPPFTVDVDKLRFIPRVQRLNELEAKTRVKLNFLDQIAKFWELQGSSLKIPMVERKALDLYSLHRIVQEEGGLECVTNGRKWSKIACRMGYPAGKSVGTILKGHYERILFPFDVFTSGKGEELKPKLESDSDDHDYKPHGILSRQKVTPPTETTARRSQRFVIKAENQKQEICEDEMKPITPQKANGETSDAINEAMNAASTARAELRRLQIYGAGPKMAGFKVRPNQPIQPQQQSSPTKSRMGGGGRQRQIPQRRNHADPLAKYICLICTRGDGEEAMLLCDGCDDSYHTFCLIPPLADIPKGDWRCPKCVVEEVSKPTEAFGFEQAQREYTLQQFGEMADQFKADYFNIPVHLVPTELVEREFWRIVSSIDEDVAVEYGADLHTMDHGSGFPTKSSLYLLPGDLEYADSSWNLNNLPLLEESVLGHINADISGMKVPWMYVGMCFATFCWHNEDHWSYSINYLHWGEPKTWYGVPGGKAEAFENTMKSAAPELFQSQPDLLHQLVTIMNPNTLMNAGVPVYRTDQHAGEFVITFPRAYHAGFNQGYNFAEAVNFAPADWIKMGRECINHYSNLRRFCVFSHDELVCKMALDPDKLNLGIATACYLDMAEMVDTEKKLRKSLLEWGVTKAEREAFELIPDDERQCDVCKTTCFLSAVTCVCIKSLVCLRHYSELCKCTPEKHTLKYRYTLDELPLMLRKLKVKAESFETWVTKVRDVLDPNSPTTMTLDELQELAQEAETKKFPTSVLLERLNSAVLEAEKCVTVIQQLDINKVRTRTRNSSFEIAKYKLTLEELDMFVQEIDNLCCIIQEGNSVRELQQMGKKFTNLASHLLHTIISEVKEEAVEKLIEDGSALCIELPQMKPLKVLLEKVRWYNCVREIRESEEKLPLPTIKRFLDEGNALSVVSEIDDTLIQKELRELEDILIDIEIWETEAKKCFESGTQHEIPDIEELLTRAESIGGKLPSQSILEDALKKAKDWLGVVEYLQTNENYPYFHTLEAVVNIGKDIPFQLEELKRMEEHLGSARSWKQKTSRTFLKRNGNLDLMEVLSPRVHPIMLSTEKTKSSETYVSKLSNEKISERVMQSFTEDKGPAQMVVAFKNAEEKEMREMRELRQKNSNKNPETDTYCICNQPFYGIMHRCHLCQDWFHESCSRNFNNTGMNSANATPTKQNRNGVTNNTTPSATSTTNPLVPQLVGRSRDRELKYLCESCQRSKRPRLETILTLLVSLQKLPIRLPEGEALQCLTERAMNWQDRARQILATEEVVNALASLQKIMNLDPKATEMNRSVDHAYSTSQANSNFQSNATDSAKANNSSELNPAGPLINLQPTTVEKIDGLMMEGDLLEVSLDETQYLWRLYNAAKEDITDLAYINSKYNIKPHTNDILVSNIRKRHSDEHLNEVLNKKAKNRNNTSVSGGNKLNSDKHNICDDDSNQDIEMFDEEILSTTSGIIAPNLNNSVNNDSTTPKVKRGRKMTITTKDNDAIITILDISNSPTADNNAAAKKKKRGRKIQTNQQQRQQNSKEDSPTMTTASTSDEDEECSAHNCIRPAGREVDWVQCDGGCNEWFHMLCVGLIKSQVKADDDFICKKCKKVTPSTPSANSTNVTPTAQTNSRKSNVLTKNDTNKSTTSNGSSVNGNANSSNNKRRPTRTNSSESSNKDDKISDGSNANRTSSNSSNKNVRNNSNENKNNSSISNKPTNSVSTVNLTEASDERTKSATSSNHTSQTTEATTPTVPTFSTCTSNKKKKQQQKL